AHKEEAYELRNKFIDEQKKIAKVGKTVPDLLPIPPQPTAAKHIVTIDLKDALKKSVDAEFIESEAEVESYLAALKEQLLVVVKAGDCVQIE
ncbi:MAG: hypothetical protein ACRC7P_04150, partial [Enterovibrio sp.]